MKLKQFYACILFFLILSTVDMTRAQRRKRLNNAKINMQSKGKATKASNTVDYTTVTDEELTKRENYVKNQLNSIKKSRHPKGSEVQEEKEHINELPKTSIQEKESENESSIQKEEKHKNELPENLKKKAINLSTEEMMKLKSKLNRPFIKKREEILLQKLEEYKKNEDSSNLELEEDHSIQDPELIDITYEDVQKLYKVAESFFNIGNHPDFEVKDENDNVLRNKKEKKDVNSPHQNLRRVRKQSENRILSSTNPSKWMSCLPDKTLIKDLKIPGSHDSGTSGAEDWTIWSKTQDWSIEQQLKNGIRFLDIRTTCEDNKIQIYHGKVYCHILLQDIVNQVNQFLDDNQNEFVIFLYSLEKKHKCKDTSTFTIKNGYTTAFKALSDKKRIFTLPKKKNFLDLTVNDVKGKVLLLQDLEEDYLGIYLDGTPVSYINLQSNQKTKTPKFETENFSIQNNWNFSLISEDGSRKLMSLNPKEWIQVGLVGSLSSAGAGYSTFKVVTNFLMILRGTLVPVAAAKFIASMLALAIIIIGAVTFITYFVTKYNNKRLKMKSIKAALESTNKTKMHINYLSLSQFPLPVNTDIDDYNGVVLDNKITLRGAIYVFDYPKPEHIYAVIDSNTFDPLKSPKKFKKRRFNFKKH